MPAGVFGTPATTRWSLTGIGSIQKKTAAPGCAIKRRLNSPGLSWLLHQLSSGSVTVIPGRNAVVVCFPAGSCLMQPASHATGAGVALAVAAAVGVALGVADA